MDFAPWCLVVACQLLGQLDAPDLRSVAQDLQVPPLGAGAAAGSRFRETMPAYAETEVYHVTYLPTDWQPAGSYPVIVEYAGNGDYRNQYGDVSTGKVEGSRLGYGITGGRGAIWVCLPYLSGDGESNVTKWWGTAPQRDARPTVSYCKRAVPWICERYGGDPRRVLLVGFSRGAIACNAIGLHDPEVAQLWRAFVAYSHYDGVVDWGFPGCDRESARERLLRLGKRPQFICAEEGQGNHAIETTRRYLQMTGVQGDFTFCGTGFRNHSDGWILRPSPARSELRRWVAAALR